MGGIQGMFCAQYKVLRENGHSPSEAFNETVEEATQSLFPLIGKYGMDYMYNGKSLPFSRLAFVSVADDFSPLLRSLSSLLHHRPTRCPRLGSPVRGG
jgi:hypothetical protein